MLFSSGGSLRCYIVLLSQFTRPDPVGLLIVLTAHCPVTGGGGGVGGCPVVQSF